MRFKSGPSAWSRLRTDRITVPERVLAVLDQFAIDFLAAEPGAAIALGEVIEKARRQDAPGFRPSRRE